MPKILDDFPDPPQSPPALEPPSSSTWKSLGRRLDKELGLRIPQVRILQVLAEAKGPIIRARITERCGYKWPTVIHDSLGSPAGKTRSAAHLARLSVGTPLFDLGYVSERIIDVDGVTEAGVEITPAGREALTQALKITGPIPPITREDEE